MVLPPQFALVDIGQVPLLAANGDDPTIYHPATSMHSRPRKLRSESSSGCEEPPYAKQGADHRAAGLAQRLFPSWTAADPMMSSGSFKLSMPSAEQIRARVRRAYCAGSERPRPAKSQPQGGLRLPEPIWSARKPCKAIPGRDFGCSRTGRSNSSMN